MMQNAVTWLYLALASFAVCFIGEFRFGNDFAFAFSLSIYATQIKVMILLQTPFFFLIIYILIFFFQRVTVGRERAKDKQRE